MTGTKDLIVIGGGLVGLATAYRFLADRPGAAVLVLEKEANVALHQSSRNSGVLHSGIYYKPGSLKAKNCIRGAALMREFCAQHQVRCQGASKLIVATRESELPGLEDIYRRGVANGISCEMLSGDQAKEIEPHISAFRAISVKSAGVCDFPGVARALKAEIERCGGEVLCNTAVTSLAGDGVSTIVLTSRGEYRGSKIINTAGLFSDRIFALSGERRDARIVPFRGEYYVIKPERRYLCKSLIYPVPNPEFPFLGVHFTRGVSGEVECGPNAVLALAREGYSWRNFNTRDMYDAIFYRGFQRFASRYWREGLSEMIRSISKHRFLAALQALIPEIQANDLELGPTGVRAQAISDEGKLVDDFLIRKTKNVVHVLNAPSPAATSCLSIAESVIEQI